MGSEQDRSADRLTVERTSCVVDAACDQPRVRAALILAAFQLMFEVFDFFMVGFLVSVIGPAWRLTFGQVAIVLLAGGVGAIIGAFVAGRVADAIGRKTVFVACALAYPAGALALAFVPNGHWVAFALIRLLVGLGFGGAGIAQVTYVSEMVRRDRRILVGSLVQLPLSLGLLLAAISASALLPTLGWRGLAALGGVPILITLAQAWVSPESLRWQIAHGDLAAARRSLEQLLRRPVIEALVAPLPAPAEAGVFALLRYRRPCLLLAVTFFGAGLAVNGILMWGPAIIAGLLDVSPAHAARWFIAVSVMGLIGRFGFAWLATRFGRRRSGEIMGYGGAAALACAGLAGTSFIGPAPIFCIAVCVAAVFCDGGYANLIPCAPEAFPTPLSARGTGFAQTFGGLAKLFAPALLALIAGSGNVISPAATQRAVGPAFLGFAGAMLGLGLAFTLFGPADTRVGRAARRDTSRGRPATLSHDSVLPRAGTP